MHLGNQQRRIGLKKTFEYMHLLNQRREKWIEKHLKQTITSFCNQNQYTNSTGPGTTNLHTLISQTTRFIRQTLLSTVVKRRSSFRNY